MNEKSTVTVSIVMPAYKVEKTLARAIDSALAQTFCALEVVVVDDGSPDRSGAIADEYAARDSRVRVVHHPTNRGLAETRRTGATAARGEWIFPLDSDDTLPTNAVKDLYDRAVEHNLDLVYGAWNRIMPAGERPEYHAREGILSGDEFLEYLLDPRCVCGSCFCLGRRALWLNDVFPPVGVRLPSEDILINVRLSAYVRRMGLFNDISIYNYYYNSDSLSVTGTLHRQPLWREHFNKIREELRRRGLDQRLEPLVRQMELHRFAFMMNEVDTSDQWYRDVCHYPSEHFTRKSRVIQRLLRHPWLLRKAVAWNRRAKQWIQKLRK